MPTIDVGAHEFRNRFGYYMERAAAGDEIAVSRRGRPYVRLRGADAPRRNAPVRLDFKDRTLAADA